MGFIVDSLANIFLETLDTLIIWICDLSASFKLDIGEQDSLFYQTFLKRSSEAQQAYSDFGFAIGALAILIVLLVTIFKIYQLIADPFTQAESPGSIFLRFIFAGVGVVGSYEIFRYFEKGFNAAYQLFTAPYMTITDAFKKRDLYILQKAEEEAPISTNDDTGSSWNSIKEGGGGFQGESYVNDTNSNADSGDAFIFGQDKLIPKDEAIASHGLALALIELVVGGALLMCLIKLIFEIYERYVIIAVLYIFSPLAFATIVSRQSTVFKNYIIMVASQFVLMCTNLVFLGVFMRAWYDILVVGSKNGVFFQSSQDFVTTMLLMIGWLIAGQKLDEHMRSLGLSAAQTGQGIMGAALGSMFLARAVVGGAIGAAGAGLGTTGKALTGQTGMQKAWQDGIDSNGNKGGLVGKLANFTNPKGGPNVADGPNVAGMPATTGNSLDDALGNSIQNSEAGIFKGESGESARGALSADAGNLHWNDIGGGIQQAYHEGSNMTITRGTNEEGIGTMQDRYGGQIDAIRYGDRGEVYHVSKGDAGGILPRAASRSADEREWT